ncbi:MAG: PQQ-like beta-propeller repeat protein [Sulfurimonas sp.]|nr:PQQ-like beta-propeller repeat protein [Sulfurimonas sp.]
MKKLYVITIVFIVIVFNACSSKEVFEPNHVVDDWKKAGNSKVDIKNIAPEAALVEDRKVLALSKVLDIQIPENYKLLGYSDGWIISANINGDLTLTFAEDKTMVEKFKLKRTIATAGIKNDILAVLFTNNEMALYSIANKELLLKEQGEAPVVVDSKMVKPYFRDDVVLFSTLDGKIVVINTKIKKKLRTVIVSSQEYFNNIIYFDLIDSKVIAATGNKILSLAQKEIRENYDIRNIISDGENIFIATKQGEVISLTPDLQQNAKIKFPFAHFLGMIINNDKLYLLEKEGYLIEASKNLSKYSIYDVDVDDGYVFIDDKIFYINDEYISVK